MRYLVAIAMVAVLALSIWLAVSAARGDWHDGEGR